MRKVIFDNETFSLELDADILIGNIRSEVIDLELAQKIVASRQKYAKGEKFPQLIKLHSLNKITKEARDFLASETVREGILAEAIVVNSVLSNTIVNFVLFLNPTSFPTKIFNDEEKAREWLRLLVVNKN